MHHLHQRASSLLNGAVGAMQVYQISYKEVSKKSLRNTEIAFRVTASHIPATYNVRVKCASFHSLEQWQLYMGASTPL